MSLHLPPSPSIENLDPFQEMALKRIWGILLKSFGYKIDLSFFDLERGLNLISSHRKQNPKGDCGEQEKAKDRNDFSESVATIFSSESPNTLTHVRAIFQSLNSGSYNENDDIFSICETTPHPSLSGFLMEDLHQGIWDGCRNTSPDRYLLSFLRVNEYDIKSSVQMIANALDWRINIAGVDGLLSEGDGIFLSNEMPELAQAFQRNEAYIRGRSRNGCPLIFIRAKIHQRAKCPDEDLEKLILLVIEWARLKFQMSRGIEQFQVVFDLTDFSIKNMDFHAVKFMIKTFQKRYPDSCDRIYVHHPPRLFSLAWNVVYPWLNEYVRGKVLFTSNYEDLHEHISSRFLPKSLGGDAVETPVFIPPSVSNLQRKPKDDIFTTLMEERKSLTIGFIEATIRWIEAKNSMESFVQLNRKLALAEMRAKNYSALDPYLRIPGVPDRNGEIGVVSY